MSVGDGTDRGLVDLRLTEEFHAAQQDGRFLCWQEMHKVGWEIGFYEDWADPVFWADDPLFELEQPLTREGLGAVERRALGFFPPGRPSIPDMPEGSFKAAMHLSWYVGQVFIENFAGRWAAGPAARSRSFHFAADLPHTAGFLDPIALFGLATQQRTGQEWTLVYDHHEELHQAWRAAGSPERVLRGAER